MTSQPRTRSTAGKPKSEGTATGLAALAKRFADAGTAAETAYAVLREAILNNMLAPGTRLRADDLAKKLGVSKTPVREALRRLQAEDYVVVGAGNALTVKVMSEKQLIEIYFTREALEGMAARLAAENAGQLDLTQLRAVLQDVEAALAAADCSGMRNYTGEFQLAVFHAAHNDFLFDLLKSLQEKIRNQKTSTLSVPGRDEEVVGFCRAVLRAIEARDPDAAERIARTNRRRTLELRLRMMRNAPGKQ
ncbi:MAG: GntR family transcriptional regulator [Xanthobacteraceae bacterium]|jgi:DNA-binding GntR family transcriptional regulator